MPPYALRVRWGMSFEGVTCCNARHRGGVRVRGRRRPDQAHLGSAQPRQAPALDHELTRAPRTPGPLPAADARGATTCRPPRSASPTPATPMPSPRTALAALTPSPSRASSADGVPGADGETELPFQRAPEGSPPAAVAEHIGGTVRATRAQGKSHCVMLIRRSANPYRRLCILWK